MAFTTDVEPGDVLQIGPTRIHVLKKNGQTTKLRIETSEHVEKTRAAPEPSASGIRMPESLAAREASRIPPPRT